MAQWPASAIVGGAALAFVAQSSATISVLAIAMVAAHLIGFEQAMLTVYGASIGSGLGTYMVAAKIRGASRQLALFQAIVKLLGRRHSAADLSGRALHARAAARRRH